MQCFWSNFNDKINRSQTKFLHANALSKLQKEIIEKCWIGNSTKPSVPTNHSVNEIIQSWNRLTIYYRRKSSKIKSLKLNRFNMMFPNVLGKYRLCHAPSHTTNSLDIKNTQSQTLTKS